MIRHIQVSGFKSLHNFSLELQPGLNVLVGPNGAGKSNIIEAFEFLAYLVDSSVGDAFGKLGGVGRILSKMPNDRYARTISICVRGEGIIGRDWYDERRFQSVLQEKRPLKNYRMVQYSYYVEVQASKTSIFVSKEVVEARYASVRRVRGRNELKYEFQQTKRPDFRLVRTGGAGEPPEISFKLRGDDAKTFSSDRMSHAIRHFRSSSNFATKSIVDELMSWGRDAVMRTIRKDVAFDPPLNVTPDAIRSLADIAEEPGIRRDGGGFAATLWAYQNDTRDQADRYTPWYRRVDRQSQADFRAQLIAQLQRVNPAIIDVVAVWEPWESKIGVRCAIKYGSGRLTMPVAGLSDGTLKWMALIAAILDRTNEFAIEEPENHVHPAVQKELVSILRERFDREDHASSFMLMSTHSESVLNAVKPHELVVVSMIDGKTVAKRPEDVEILKAEIQRTGFGLGHYYLMGALDE